MRFERGKDPKETMGIGIFSTKKFSNWDEAKTWLLQNHVAILKLDGLCNPYPTPKQFKELWKYVDEYIWILDDLIIWEIDELVEEVAQLYRELNYIKKLSDKKS